MKLTCPSCGATWKGERESRSCPRCGAEGHVNSHVGCCPADLARRSVAIYIRCHPEDVAALDRYAEEHGFTSRSLAALALLRKGMGR